MIPVLITSSLRVVTLIPPKPMKQFDVMGGKEVDRYRSQHFPIGLLQGFDAACWLLRKCPMEMQQEKVCVCVTWDICGRRLISLRLTACGSRLLSNWQSSTPSLRA